MMPSVEYLQQTGLVSDPAAIGHPLTQIRIIDATGRLIRAPETLFDASEAGLPAFGWNFPNVKRRGGVRGGARRALATSRRSRRRSRTREPATPGWTLRLGTGETLTAGSRGRSAADGKKSRVRESAGDFRARENGFREAALVCDLALERPIGGTSVEFHYERGPFTLVPGQATTAAPIWCGSMTAPRSRVRSAADPMPSPPSSPRNRSACSAPQRRSAPPMSSCSLR